MDPVIRIVFTCWAVILLPSLWMGSALPAHGASLKNPAQCVSLRKKLNGREVVINACEECKVVRVERQRAGGGVPNFRTLVVQKKAAADLPFRGPGRTRLVGADPCKG